MVKMEKLKIVSLNVRGLGNDVKRRKVFRYFKHHKADICLIQESHCVNDVERIWMQEWGRKCLYANGTQGSRGVAILLNKKCRYVNK